MRLLPLTLAIGLLPGAPLGAKESPPPPCVAVLDFATPEDIAWLSAGFSATLSARLDLVVPLRVADPFETRATARRRSAVADDNAQVQALGQELSADYVLTGQILKEETNLTITAWLVNVKTGRRQGEQKLTGRQDALFALQNQFLAGWLRPLRLKLSQEEEARVAAYLPTESLLAFEFFGRGLAQYNPDRPLEALGIWEQAVEFDPNFALAREAQGRAACRYQELLYEQALQQYQQALSLTPDNARLHYLLALAYYDHRQFDDALKELREALRLKPNYLEAHYQLGLLYLSGLHRPAEAAQAFNAVLVMEPTHVKALNNLGVALWESNHREEARAAWQEVLRHDPENPSAQENLRRFGR